MILGESNGYTFYVSTSGGSAGKGKNRTANLQVRTGSGVAARFRFVVGDRASQSAAVAKARAYVAQRVAETVRPG